MGELRRRARCDDWRLFMPYTEPVRRRPLTSDERYLTKAGLGWRY
jgi:hypothetical protein